LKCVSGHKLTTLTCPRKYYWKWIRNLEKKTINLNFWYGSVLGAGFEAMLKGQDWRKAMKVEDQKRILRKNLTHEDRTEMVAQRQLIEVILANAEKLDAVQAMKLDASQEQFAIELDNGVHYCGTPDGIGTYEDKPCLYEFKTAGRINAAYLDALKYGKQINGYSWALSQQDRPIYNILVGIFIKTAKRVKKNQTIDDFVEEIKNDSKYLPEKFYYFDNFLTGKRTVQEVAIDIQKTTAMLYDLYASKSKEELLDPYNWPRMETKCFEYSGCEFQQLCKNARNWEAYEMLFQQREMLYPLELEELDKKPVQIKKKVKKVKKVKKLKKK